MADENKVLQAEEDTTEVNEATEMQAAEAEVEIKLVETGTVDVKSRVDRNTMNEIIENTYNHAKDTMKPGDKLDWFVACCGIFAIICLVVSIVNVVRYGFDILFGVMMVIYVVVAVFCLVKKLQLSLNHLTWKLGFQGKLMASKAEEQMVHFGVKTVSFLKKKEEEYEYEILADAYETENYYIFHFNDKKILPVMKADVTEAEQEYEDTDLQKYFCDLCLKYAKKEDTLVD